MDHSEPVDSLTKPDLGFQSSSPPPSPPDPDRASSHHDQVDQKEEELHHELQKHLSLKEEEEEEKEDLQEQLMRSYGSYQQQLVEEKASDGWKVEEEERGSDGWKLEGEERGLDGWKLEGEERGSDGWKLEEEDRASNGWKLEEEERGSNGWKVEEDEGWNGWKSEGEGHNENEKVGEELEESDRSNGIRRHHQYPVRPDAEDCAYYMKTGTCKFGSNCRFNHPVRRKTQISKDKLKEGEEVTEKSVPGQTECKYYLRTGGCKYGKNCRYNHSRVKTSGQPMKAPSPTYSVPAAELNFLGLPIRLGEKECPYYMRNGSCKYGANCRFNHPDPTVVGGSDAPPTFGNGGPTMHNSSQSSVASWSSPRALNEPAPFVPVMFPPTQGVPPHNPEWNGYQAPVYPPERGIHPPPPPPYVLSNLTTESNVYAHQPPQILDEFPERPGQQECTYYMKTGDCKFKSNCKFHHPKNRFSKSSPCILSDKGLPLRPDQNICSHYSRYGICKFGPACKFNHPVEVAPSAESVADRMKDFDGEDNEEARLAECGNGSAIQQPV